MKYKVGDKVFITKFIGDPIPGVLGKIGVIANIDHTMNKYPIDITVDNGASCYGFDEKELIPVNEKTKILFGDKND